MAEEFAFANDPTHFQKRVQRLAMPSIRGKSCFGLIGASAHPSESGQKSPALADGPKKLILPQIDSIFAPAFPSFDHNDLDEF